MYVIRKENQYCYLDNNKAVRTTDNLMLAKKFQTSDEAFQLLHYATKKLKGFSVLDLNTNKTVKYVAKCKREAFNATQRTNIYNKDNGICAICGKFVPLDDYTVDHIIPISKGGTNDMGNLQCAHKVCNQVKQDILPEDLMDKLSDIVVYQMEKNYNDELYKKIRHIRRKQRKGGVLAWIFGC